LQLETHYLNHLWTPSSDGWIEFQTLDVKKKWTAVLALLATALEKDGIIGNVEFKK
jgi:hypothetical protein